MTGPAEAVQAGLRYRRQVEEMLRAYRESQVLITCAELGVFEALASSGLAAPALAERLRVDAVALERLLNAAVALGLLDKRGDEYLNGDLARACLADEGPFYLGNLVKREGAFYRRWSRLNDAVRTGQRPVENARDERQANWVREFELALRDVARTPAPVIAEILGPMLPRDRPARLIDIGGGHGAYSLALAERYPNLEAVVFDLPPVIEVTRELIAHSPARERVRVQAGDFKSDALGRDFDLALLFGVLVSEPAPDAQALLRKVHAAVVPGGHVAIRGFYLDGERTGPRDAVLADLHMLLSTGAGGAHTVAELQAWLNETGFASPQVIDLPAPERSRILVAAKLS